MSASPYLVDVVEARERRVDEVMRLEHSTIPWPGKARRIALLRDLCVALYVIEHLSRQTDTEKKNEIRS